MRSIDILTLLTLSHGHCRASAVRRHKVYKRDSTWGIYFTGYVLFAELLMPGVLIAIGAIVFPDTIAPASSVVTSTISNQNKSTLDFINLLRVPYTHS